LAIAEQDFDGSGDLCIRCHSTSGWYGGRSTPTDGSGLAAGDANGVDCDTCHKMTNPNNLEHLGVVNSPFIANNGLGIGYYGSGILSLWGGSEKLGPLLDANPNHQFLQSDFHRSQEFCGSCHDVSNPVVGDLAHNNGAQATGDPVTASGVLGGPIEDKAAFNNFPYQYGIVERTYSEYYSGALPGILVSDYASLPSDLQDGAIQMAYQSAGGNYADGTDRTFTCQTCHMHATTGPACNKNGIAVRTDLPLHDMTGGNYWIPDAILYQNTQGTLRQGGGLTTTQINAINAGKNRALQQLNLAASLLIDGNTLKVTNLTGHKLISGYPEGRRMWLNVKWYDTNNGLVREDGQYGEMTVDINGTPTTVKTILNLSDPNTKIYETHHGMTQEWANQLLTLGYSADMPLSYDRITGMVDYTLGDLAGQVPGTDHETFHFVLNNTVVEDNRIPTYGMAYEEARKRNALPVPASQYGNPAADGTYNYWDNITLNPPTGAVYANVYLMYQPTSWEYIQFLYQANNGQNAFLANEGENMLDAWLNTGMAEPVVMASASWSTTINDAPSAFSKTSPGNGATGQSINPTLIWSQAAGSDSYEFCYDTSNDSTCSNWVGNGSSTSVDLSNLSADTTYYWHVRAINASGTTYSNDSASTFWSFTTTANPPGAFDKNSPSDGAPNQLTDLTLSWGGSSGATSYEYCLDMTINSSCDASWTDNGTSTSKGLTGLTPGAQYEWHVRAVNSGVATYSDSSATAFWAFTVQTSSDPPLDPSKLHFQEVSAGLDNPVFISHAGDGSNRMYIVERRGRIRILKNGALLTTPFIDIQSIVKSTYSEQGLLGLAFHPSYESNGKFYVVYTAPKVGDANGSILTLRQYSVSTGNPDIANTSSGINILTIDHPTYSNHNGGTISFGNDGYLYWSIGDGGGGGDPGQNAQDLTSLLGKILRIDVSSGSPYTIPADNPFFANPDPSIKKEIWAYGLRNPWRMSFDSLTYDLYIGDVGQSSLEEIDYQSANSTGGENYGWRVMEGSQCYSPSSGCDESGKILPIAEYDHTLGCAVTGGYVYRGSSYPSLTGYYLYGDYCSGRLFSTYNNLPSDWSTPIQLADTPYVISTFGEDENGELYLTDYYAGKIYKIQYDEITITGNVEVPGVTLSYTDGTAKTATSQTDGSYSFTVSYDWSGTVTPTHACYTFSPTSRTYNNVIANQTGENYTPTFDNSSGCADVDVFIGGALQNSYAIASGENVTPRYEDTVDGPVQVVSTNGQEFFTSERSLYKNSFNEVMGYPGDQLTTEYWFPWYDNIGMTTWVLVGNPSTTETAEVDVYIGEVLQGSYTILPGEKETPKYTNVLDGPVRVVSTNGVDIFASERSLYKDSFNEVMGYPGDQLTTEYWFPWYDNIGMKTWVLVGVP
jgi:glucose/arabinose dehydrogenase